jgi:hypothetical protein
MFLLLLIKRYQTLMGLKHNYARWNGAIIGQGGPTNAQYASIWSQLAAKYKSDPKIIVSANVLVQILKI